MIVDALCNVHTHLREGDVVHQLIKLAIEGGADTLLPMPNTNAGLLTARQVLAYIAHAKEGVPEGQTVNLIPTILINEDTFTDEIDRCVDNGIINAKVYPRYRTTNSGNGVRHYGRLLSLLKWCGRRRMKLHFHPEHPWMLFNGRDAEFAFLPVADMFLNETDACIVWEHGTDGRCVLFWKEMAKSHRFFVTLTAHHLATDEDESFGDVRSVCKPPIKTRCDKEDLVRLVEEDHLWVMAGGDDAYHDTSKKHPEWGRCACGAFTTGHLLKLYAHTLGRMIRMDGGGTIFRRFTSENARRLHGLPGASRKYLLTEEHSTIPLSYRVGEGTGESFWAGRTIDWNIQPL